MKQHENFLSDMGQAFKGVKSSSKNDFRKFLVNDNSSSSMELNKAFAEVAMGRDRKALLKEKLYTVLGVEDVVVGLSAFLKPAFASFLVLAFVFSSVLDIEVFGGANVAKASDEITVAAVSGNVTVERLGQNLSVYSGFRLLEDDKIVTNSGFLEIKFQDDSVARLSSNTELSLARVDGFSGKSDATLNLKKGKVWFNALSKASGSSEYDLQMRDILVQIEDEAVLNMEVGETFTKVIVFDEEVEVNYKSKSGFKSSILGKGDLIKVKKDQDSLNVVDSVLLAENISNNNVNWYLENLKLDSLYKKKMGEDKLLISKEKITIRPDSLWYPLKELQRSAKVALSLDPVKKAEVKLEIADEKLHEAKVLSVEGKNDLAKKNLEQYKETVTEVLKVVEENKASLDSGVSAIIQSEVETLVKEHKDVLADTDDKELKRTVLETELSVAEVSGESTKVKLKQLEDKLDEAEDLIKEAKLGELVEDPVVVKEEDVEELVTEALTEFDEVISGVSVDDENAEALEYIKEKAQSLELIKEPVEPVVEVDNNVVAKPVVAPVEVVELPESDVSELEVEASSITEVIELDEDVVILKLDDEFIEKAVEEQHVDEIEEEAGKEVVEEQEKSPEEVVSPEPVVEVLDDVSESEDKTE